MQGTILPSSHAKTWFLGWQQGALGKVNLSSRRTMTSVTKHLVLSMLLTLTSLTEFTTSWAISKSGCCCVDSEFGIGEGVSSRERFSYKGVMIGILGWRT